MSEGQTDFPEIADTLVEVESWDVVDPGEPEPIDDDDLDPETFLSDDFRGLEVIDEPSLEFVNQDGTDDDEFQPEGEGGSIPSYVRNTDQATAWGRARIDGPLVWYRRCLSFARQCPNCPSGASYAYQAWDQCPSHLRKHTTNFGAVKRGTISVWANGGAGHATFNIGGGLTLSNDYHRSGGINIAPLAALGPWCGGTYRGFIYSVNGVQFKDPSPKPKELGKVSISDIRRAALRDPKRPHQGTTAGAKADVIQIERALHARGYLGADYVDGSYGSKTRAAALHFENDIHAPAADGILGPHSLPRLGKGRFKVVK